MTTSKWKQCRNAIKKGCKRDENKGKRCKGQENKSWKVNTGK